MSTVKASFTKEFVVADEETCKFAWSSIPLGEAFFCAFCQHQFAPGDEYRMCYTNDLSGYGGNPLTCRKCFDFYDGIDGLRQQWKQMWNEYRQRFKWWYVRD